MKKLHIVLTLAKLVLYRGLEKEHCYSGQVTECSVMYVCNLLSLDNTTAGEDEDPDRLLRGSWPVEIRIKAQAANYWSYSGVSAMCLVIS